MSEARDSTVDRYQRQQLVHGLDRKYLQTLRFAVIGAGAVGNEVIKNLALMGVGQIDIYDFDRIEIHNLTRSVLFRETDIGESKASVAARRATDINPDVVFRAGHADLWNCLNIGETARYDCVFACVDNFEARMRASLLCRIAGVDFISVAIDSRYVSVQRHPFGSELRPDDLAVACYECDMAQAAYQTVAQRYSCGWLRKLATDVKTVPTTAITASIAGAQAVARALATGMEESLTSASRLLFDTHSGYSTPTRLDLNEDCLACGGLPIRPSLASFSGTLESLKKQKEQNAMLEIEFSGSRVVFSEALVSACRCVNDDQHAQQLHRSARLAPARIHSEAITWCSLCEDSSIDIEINEAFSITDWQQQFDGAELGCRFISVIDAAGKLAVLDNSSAVSAPLTASG